MTEPLAPVAQAVREQLRDRGWAHVPAFQVEDDGGARLEALSALLGRPHPTVANQAVRPSAEAAYTEPFDGLDALGWHNDLSTWPRRPRLTLSWLTRADPSGGGAWRVASVADVIGRMRMSASGRQALARLTETHPYSFTGVGEARWFRPRTRTGLRFYPRTMRDGALIAWGEIPPRTERMLREVEKAADVVGTRLPPATGDLLVVDCWRSLHDRERQGSGRRAVLAFVAASFGTNAPSRIRERARIAVPDE